MSIANEITYQGKLECFSEKVANSEIQISDLFLNKVNLALFKLPNKKIKILNFKKLKF